jgi:hypothetical protein
VNSDIVLLRNMQLGDERQVGPSKYLRVPGGWLVHVSNLENAPMCFVPEPPQQDNVE